MSEKMFKVRAALNMRDVSDADGFSYQDFGDYLMEPEFEATCFQVVQVREGDEVASIAYINDQHEAVLTCAHLNSMHSSLLSAQAELSVYSNISGLSESGLFAKSIQMKLLLRIAGIMEGYSSGALSHLVTSNVYKKVIGP